MQEEISYIEWYPNGKIKEIHTLTSSHKPNVYFEYDPMGIRTLKVEKTKDGMGDLNPEEDWIYTWYGLDANGTTLAVYGQTENLAKIYAKELYIYGSKRLAVKNTNIDAHNPPDTTGYSKRELGKKYFELADYLGNVKEVISDRKLAIFDGGGDFEYFYPQIVSFTDYYPFGMSISDRSFNGGSYRHQFNGMETDSEVSGNGNSYTTYFRQYDPRLGRWKSIDPKIRAWESPYAGFANNPILWVDPKGDTIFHSSRTEGNKTLVIIIVDDIENTVLRENGKTTVTNFNSSLEGFNENEFDYIIANDINDVTEWMEKNYEKGEIEQMFFGTHSHTNYRGDQHLKKRDIYMPNQNGGKFHITSDELISGKSSSKNEKINTLETKIIENMKEVFSYMDPDGDLMFGMCSYGVKIYTDDEGNELMSELDEDNLNALNEFVGLRNGNIYISTNSVKRVPNGDMTNDDSFEDQRGWLIVNKKGVTITNSDMNVNKNTGIVKPIEKKATGTNNSCGSNSCGNNKSSKKKTHAPRG